MTGALRKNQLNSMFSGIHHSVSRPSIFAYLSENVFILLFYYYVFIILLLCFYIKLCFYTFLKTSWAVIMAA